MGGADNREIHYICGRELAFRAKLKPSFLFWYEKNYEVSHEEEICTNFIESLDIQENDVKVDFLNNEEKLEILKTVARENDFNNMLIHSCNDFVVGLNDYYKSNSRNIAGNIEEISENIKNFAKLVGSVALAVQEPLERISSSIGRIISSIDFDKLRLLIEAFEKLPDSVKEMHEKLMLQGWYLPYSVLMELDPSFAYKIIDSDIDEINKEMFLVAQDIEDDLLHEVKESFSSRYSFINESLKYHKEGNYKISIPIMLIHADGITIDIFGNHLFMEQDNRKKLVKKLDEDEGFGYSLSLSPLTMDSAITISKYKRKDKEYYKFNRHEILHGEDLEYGTKENSYRCIMLLKYLIDVNDYIKKYKQELD